MSEMNRLYVWRGERRLGVLTRTETGRFRLEYDDGLSPDEAVSKTLPVGSAWEADRLFPVFETGLPEGALAAELTRRHGKDGFQGPMGLLALTGANRVGDLSFSLDDRAPGRAPETPPELLRAALGSDAKAAFERLLETRAEHSGVAGVQPKVLADDDVRTIVDGRWIVKRSSDGFPFLAANERFCLLAAEKAGLPVAESSLSEDGEVLLVKRFDRTVDGARIAMEDFCGVMARQADEKYGIELREYARSLETALPGPRRIEAAERMLKITILNAMLRNGDAHARNFAVLGRGADASLAPVYDVCTTCVYKGFGADKMSQRIAGNDGWPDRRRVLQAAAIFGVSPAKTDLIVEECRAGVLEAAKALRDEMARNPALSEIGWKLIETWDKGIRNTLAPGKTKPSQWPTSGMEDAVPEFALRRAEGVERRLEALRESVSAAPPSKPSIAP